DPAHVELSHPGHLRTRQVVALLVVEHVDLAQDGAAELGPGLVLVLAKFLFAPPLDRRDVRVRPVEEIVQLALVPPETDEAKRPRRVQQLPEEGRLLDARFLPDLGIGAIVFVIDASPEDEKTRLEALEVPE